MHHSSSQLPQERQAQGWTVGDRGTHLYHGYMVYEYKWYRKRVRILIFPEVIAPITGRDRVELALPQIS
jgi:hypothetical protein